MPFAPTIDEERRLALSRRVPEVETSWRSSSLRLALVFFVLTAIGAAAFIAFFNLIGVDYAVAGVLCIACAEVLIVRRRWFRTGVESALWVAGAVAIGIRINERDPLLTIAILLAIAAVRLRNAFVGVAAAIALAAATNDAAAASVFALVTAVVALFALARTWRRPSIEHAAIGLLLVMPIVAAVAARRWEAIAWLLLVLATAQLFAGIRLRHHAPLLGALVCVTLAANVLYERIPLAVEWQLAIAGAALLAIAFFVSRYASEEDEDLTGEDESLSIGASIVSAPSNEAPETRRRGEGGFGGAGATGDF